jgi:hypothetical protein
LALSTFALRVGPQPGIFHGFVIGLHRPLRGVANREASLVGVAVRTDQKATAVPVALLLPVVAVDVT